MTDRDYCNECDRTFGSPQALEEHQRTKHSRTATGVPGKRKRFSFRNLPKNKRIAYIGYVIGIALIIWGIAGFFQDSDTPTGSSVALVSEDPFLGDDDAPVTVLGFVDYQCPECRTFWESTMPRLNDEYITTGKVKYVFIDFPSREEHTQSQASAEAANCVLDQGGKKEYFEYQDTLFAHQASLSEENLKLWASDLGFDISDCLESDRYRQEIDEDIQQARGAGARSAPAFVINGRLVSGAQPFHIFKDIIDEELEEADD